MKITPIASKNTNTAALVLGAGCGQGYLQTFVVDTGDGGQAEGGGAGGGAQFGQRNAVLRHECLDLGQHPRALGAPGIGNLALQIGLLLLECGADVDLADKSGWSALL